MVRHTSHGAIKPKRTLTVNIQQYGISLTPVINLAKLRKSLLVGGARREIVLAAESPRGLATRTGDNAAPRWCGSSCAGRSRATGTCTSSIESWRGYDDSDSLHEVRQVGASSMSLVRCTSLTASAPGRDEWHSAISYPWSE
jgi:hypothetical protein